MWTKARRASMSCSDAKPAAIAVMSAPTRRPICSTQPPSLEPALTSGWEASSGRTYSAAGSATARSTGVTARPSPPLETSTSRSTRSGNW